MRPGSAAAARAPRPRQRPTPGLREPPPRRGGPARGSQPRGDPKCERTPALSPGEDPARPGAASGAAAADPPDPAGKPRAPAPHSPEAPAPRPGAGHLPRSAPGAPPGRLQPAGPSRALPTGGGTVASPAPGPRRDPCRCLAAPTRKSGWAPAPGTCGRARPVATPAGGRTEGAACRRGGEHPREPPGRPAGEERGSGLQKERPAGCPGAQ